MKINYTNSPSFKSTYTVDTSTATSKRQIFMLGALMNNFWLNNPNTTFFQIKNSGVYGKIDMDVKDYRDKAFESVLRNNNISYQKKETNFNYYA